MGSALPSPRPAKPAGRRRMVGRVGGWGVLQQTLAYMEAPPHPTAARGEGVRKQASVTSAIHNADHDPPCTSYRRLNARSRLSGTIRRRTTAGAIRPAPPRA